MKMTNGKELKFEIRQMAGYVTVMANGWSLLIIRDNGSSFRVEGVHENTGLNLDEKGRLAIDQPLRKPPVERFCWVFEMGGQTFDSAPLSEEEASIMLPENRVKLPWTRKTS